MDSSEDKYNSLGILIPSRERPDSLKRVLYELANSDNSDLLEVIVASDNCPETFRIIKEFPLQEKFLKYKPLITRRRFYTIKTINFCLENCESFLFAWCADDMVIDRKDWIGFSISRFRDLFPDNVGLMSLTSPGPASGLTSKEFIEYNDGEGYHNGYMVHYADMEVGVRAVLMGRYCKLGVVRFLRHKGGKDDIPPVGSGKLWGLKLSDKRLYEKRKEMRFYLDPNKIVHPNAEEIFKLLEKGIFDWPSEINIPFKV